MKNSISLKNIKDLKMLNVTKNVTLPLDNALLIVSFHLVPSS